MSHWDETKGRSIPDDSLLTDEDLARCARADTATPRTPVPTQLVSNGEYPPLPQSPQQKRVEARVQEMAEASSQQLGVSRRNFLTSSGGMAASFLAMNEVFGPFFDVDSKGLLIPEAHAAAAPPRDLFVFDDQLHMVRGSRYDAAAPLRRPVSVSGTL